MNLTTHQQIELIEKSSYILRMDCINAFNGGKEIVGSYELRQVLVKLIEFYGGEIINRDNQWFIGNRHNLIIYLSPFTSSSYDNFYILFKLAKYLTDSKLQEWQYNRFAAAFMIPRKELIREVLLSKFIYGIKPCSYVLSAYFGCHIKTIEERLRTLKL